MRCSFCHKSEDTVGKLISSPQDYPRSYICDECICVCASILEDDKPEVEAAAPTNREAGVFFTHPLALDFLRAAEQWAVRDLRGLAASRELDQMRVLAARMLADSQD